MKCFSDQANYFSSDKETNWRPDNNKKLSKNTKIREKENVFVVSKIL